MGILSWLVIGALAGWVGGMLMKVHAGGLIGNIVVGILGAMIGGGVMSFIGKSGVSGFNFWSFFVALVGALILLWVVKIVRK